MKKYITGYKDVSAFIRERGMRCEPSTAYNHAYRTDDPLPRAGRFGHDVVFDPDEVEAWIGRQLKPARKRKMRKAA